MKKNEIMCNCKILIFRTLSVKTSELSLFVPTMVLSPELHCVIFTPEYSIFVVDRSFGGADAWYVSKMVMKYCVQFTIKIFVLIQYFVHYKEAMSVVDAKAWPAILDSDDLPKKKLTTIYKAPTPEMMCYLDFSVSTTGMLAGVKVSVIGNVIQKNSSSIFLISCGA